MITVAICNSKGGVGKTLLSANLAVEASNESARVCLIDLDPQKSLVEWWKRRDKKDNPTIFRGVDHAADAVERANLAGYDFCFLDGPPGSLTVTEEMIATADFVVIPVKPSMSDLLASEDTVAIALDTGAAFLVVFNDVGARETPVNQAREFLFNADVPIADTTIIHRPSYIHGMDAGKAAGEVRVNGRRDSKAGDAVAALWAEVKAAALAAVRVRAKEAADHA
jgi:chromosome partitioning protein